ncbi:MAG: hypothetical protein RR557_06910 [Bacilli bacterium]
MNRIYFKEVEQEINSMLSKEKITISESYTKNFISILPSFFNYKEESTSIRPSIFFTKNVEKIISLSEYTKKIVITKDDVLGTNLKKILKMLLPFCNTGWVIYIDFSNESVEYGLLRSLSGIRGYVTQKELLVQTYEEDVSLLLIDLISEYELKFHGIKKVETVIDFRFDSTNVQSESNDILESMSKDLVSGLVLPANKRVIDSVKKLINTLYLKSHGTIILIMNDKCDKLPTDIFLDGTWLIEPIDLIAVINSIDNNLRGKGQDDEALRYKGPTGMFLGDKETDLEFNLEKYYAYSGLLFEMINVDGVTILNNKGQIIGYNCFAKNESENTKTTVGGARKRAFEAICNNKNEDIIGIYFQSQNGDKIYKKRCADE